MIDKPHYGKGTYERGKYRCNVNGKVTREYRLWSKMLERCYSPKFNERKPSYIDVEVSEELLNFQNFCEIITKISYWNIKDENNKYFHMDKDLFGLEEYSKDVIVFIPCEINTFLTNNQNQINKNKELPIGVSLGKKSNKYKSKMKIKGENINLGYYDTIEEAYQVYCKARNQRAKTLAEKYKDVVEPRVYEALMKYDEEYFL